MINEEPKNSIYGLGMWPSMDWIAPILQKLATLPPPVDILVCEVWEVRLGLGIKMVWFSSRIKRDHLKYSSFTQAHKVYF
jgi:hypothetical protein